MRAFRRRRQLKTDYRKRIALLKSGKPRLVVRRYNNTIIVQLVEFNKHGDRSAFTVSSKKLRNYGWEGHGGNIPAAYLTGYLAGKMAMKKGYNEAVLDIGISRSTKSNAIFAAAKGAVDAGLSMPFSHDVDESRIKGEHIKAFSGKDIPAMFEKVKENIEKGD